MDQETKDELLVYCLRIGAGETKPARLERLSDSDWDEIVQRSDSHGLAPLLYHRFGTTSLRVHIPTGAMEMLQRIHLHSSWENTRLYYELSKVLTALRNNDIPVIVLKGAALAKLIYQNIPLRPMNDVDLLVKGQDIWKTDKILSQLGYESDIAFLLSKRHSQWTQHVTYKGRNTLIEVHPDRIYELPNLNPWANAAAVTIASAEVLILGPEDFLLHLCLHLDRHLRNDRSTRLIWWCDIEAVLKHYRRELNWEYTMRIAKEHRVEGAVHRILHVVHQELGGYVPPHVLSQLKDNGAVISINDVVRFTGESTTSGQKDLELNLFLSFISRVPSIHGRVYHFFRCIIPCRERMIYSYSITRPNSVYFYYFIHIAKFVAKAAKALSQLPGYLRNRRVSPEPKAESLTPPSFRN